MKTITKYQANDGSEWTTEEAAMKRDALIVEVDQAIRPFGPRIVDEGCKFANGHGYVQHSRQSYAETRAALTTILLREFGPMPSGESPDALHVSWLARFAGECAEPLHNAFYRLYCTDEEFREWGQPYYALNPGRGEEFVLEDRR